MSYPPFIDPTHTNMLQIPPPYSFETPSGLGLESQIYFLLGDSTKLQTICDLHLNIAPPHQLAFRPLTSDISNHLLPNVVLFQINQYQHITSDVSPYSGYGYIEANEALFTFCVERGSIHGGQFVVEPDPSKRYYLYIPYIFISQPWSVVSANCTFGFAKQQSWFRIPSDLKIPTGSTVETLVYQKFAPKTRQTRERFLEISKTNQSDTTMTSEDISAKDIHGILEIPLLSLKQFRDAENPCTACFQALVSSPLQDFTEVAFGPMDLVPTVNIYDYASLPIVEALGIPQSSPAVGIWATLNLRFGNSTNLYVNS